MLGAPVQAAVGGPGAVGLPEPAAAADRLPARGVVPAHEEQDEVGRRTRYPPARAGARTRRAAAQRVRRAWSARRAARAVRVRTVRLRDTRAAPATAPNSVA